MQANPNTVKQFFFASTAAIAAATGIASSASVTTTLHTAVASDDSTETKTINKYYDTTTNNKRKAITVDGSSSSRLWDHDRLISTIVCGDRELFRRVVVEGESEFLRNVKSIVLEPPTGNKHPSEFLEFFKEHVASIAVAIPEDFKQHVKSVAAVLPTNPAGINNNNNNGVNNETNTTFCNDTKNYYNQKFEDSRDLTVVIPDDFKQHIKSIAALGPAGINTHGTTFFNTNTNHNDKQKDDSNRELNNVVSLIYDRLKKDGEKIISL